METIKYLIHDIIDIYKGDDIFEKEIFSGDYSTIKNILIINYKKDIQIIPEKFNEIVKEVINEIY